MLTIRLTRKGKKNQPFFRVVVIDKRRSSKGGRSVEDLGYVNPLTKKISLKKERIQHWIKNGAQSSATIHNLLVKEGIIEGKKIHVSKLSKKKLAEIDASKKTEADKAATPAPAAETPVEAPAEAPKEEAPVETAVSVENSGEPKPAETPKELPAEEKPAELPAVEEKPAEELKPEEPKA